MNPPERDRLLFAFEDEDSNQYVATLEKGRDWHEGSFEPVGDAPATKPYGWGSKTYTPHLSSADILSWLQRDYGRKWRVSGGMALTPTQRALSDARTGHVRLPQLLEGFVWVREGFTDGDIRYHPEPQVYDFDADWFTNAADDDRTRKTRPYMLACQGSEPDGMDHRDNEFATPQEAIAYARAHNLEADSVFPVADELQW